MTPEQKVEIFENALLHLLKYDSLKYFEWDDDLFTCSEEDFAEFLTAEEASLTKELQKIKARIYKLSQNRFLQTNSTENNILNIEHTFICKDCIQESESGILYWSLQDILNQKLITCPLCDQNMELEKSSSSENLNEDYHEFYLT